MSRPRATTWIAGIFTAVLLSMGYLATGPLSETANPTPEGGPGASGTQTAGQSNKRVTLSKPTNNYPLAPDTAGIVVRVVGLDGSPVTGVTVQLLPPRAGALWTDKSAATAQRLGSANSNDAGECFFADLKPGKSYQLYCQSDGVFLFDAQPSPIRPSLSDGGRRRISLGNPVSAESYRSQRVSGRIPTKSNTVTATRLWTASGVAVSGRLDGGPFDVVSIVLARRHNDVIAPLDTSSSASFSFRPVASLGKLRLAGQARRGHNYFFAVREFETHQASSAFIALQPVLEGGEAVVKLRVVPRELEVLEPLVKFSFTQGPSGTFGNIELTAENPVRLSGAVGGSVHSLRLSRTLKSDRLSKQVRDRLKGYLPIHWKPARILGSGPHFLKHGLQEVVLEARRIQPSESRSVALRPTTNSRYESKVQVRFLDKDGNKLWSEIVDPGNGLTKITGRWWNDLSRVEIRSHPENWTSVLDQVMASSRTGTLLQLGEFWAIQDPGPPNGLGVSLPK